MNRIWKTLIVMYNKNMHIDFSIKIREIGLKVTQSRVRVLSMLHDTGKPVSVEDIKKKIKKMDKATIYRILESFFTRNLISKINLGRDRMYFEYIHTHHHHIICTLCGDFEDIKTCATEKESSVLKGVKKFAAISSHSLEFFGTCKKCAHS